MSIDPEGRRSGELLEAHVDVKGVRIELLAVVQVSGTTVHLQDLAIYPAGVERATVGVAALLRAARRGPFHDLRVAGFERLRITATRLSGANPGRTVDLTIDLTREAT
ncbi:MAG: hypothetical protein QOE58_3533 [Actinomycetota bacterium]|nr:hypothetical protein [Actinomycetota bacterium]